MSDLPEAVPLESHRFESQFTGYPTRSALYRRLKLLRRWVRGGNSRQGKFARWSGANGFFTASSKRQGSILLERIDPQVTKTGKARQRTPTRSIQLPATSRAAFIRQPRGEWQLLYLRMFGEFAANDWAEP